MFKRRLTTQFWKRICGQTCSSTANGSSRRFRTVSSGTALSEVLESRCLLTPQLISLAADATSGDDDSFDPQISRDGRYLAFQSRADNLVAANGTDGNSFEDVFVRDLATGETTLVSVTPEGLAGDNHSFQPSISDNGRFIAFGSLARNLVDEVMWIGGSHVFVRDRDVDGDGVFDEPGDSRTILVTQDPTIAGTSSDQQSGGFAGDAWTLRPLISGAGSSIVFASSATNLLDPEGIPTDGAVDIDLYKADAPFGGGVELISVNFDGTAAAIRPGTVGLAITPAISATGEIIAYASDFTDIVAGDDEGFTDVFAGRTRVSETAFGKGGDGDSTEPIVSRNGRHVVFRSVASNLVDGDNNQLEDIFVADLKSQRITLVSQSRDPASGSRSGNGDSPLAPSPGDQYAISDDGRFVVFASTATDLLDPAQGITDSNGTSDVFVLDRDADGDRVFDEPGPLATRTIPVSISADNMAMANSLPGTGGSSAVSISQDGRYVVFTSEATNLVEGDTSGVSVFLRDLWANATFLIGESGTANVLQDSATESQVSVEPLRVVFSGASDIDPKVTDTNIALDIFQWDAPVDIRMRGVIGDGYDLLEIQYEVQNAATSEFQIGVYRSADGVFDLSDSLLDTILITGTDLDVGGHAIVRQIGADTEEQIILPGVGTSIAAMEDDSDYQILFVADHLNTIAEFDLNDFNDDNTARFENIYHLPEGPVFIHGRTGAVVENDRLTITEIDEAQTDVTLNLFTYGYDPMDVTGYRFRGHEGGDTAQAAGTPDLLIGGPGSDALSGGPGDDYIDGGIDDDKLFGEEGFDTILDGMGDDFIDIGPDGGVIVATPGSDDIFLGAGDALDFSFADRAITIDLDLDAIQTVDDDLNTITLDGVWDNFIGSAFDDFVSGKVTDRDRDLNGGDGEDRVNIDAGGGSVTFDGATLVPTNGGAITFTDFEDINVFNFPPITIDNSDAGYSDTGFFDSDSNFPQGVNGGVRFGTAGNGYTATWTFTDLLPGLFSVAATWTNAPDRASNATYVINDGATILGDAIVNQRNAPADFNADGFDWADLGTFDFPPNATTLTVELSDATANGFVAADAIRITPIDPATRGLSPQLTVHLVNANARQTVPVDNGATVDLGDVPQAADDSARFLMSTFILQNTGEAKLLLDQATITGPFTIAQSAGELPANAAGNIKVTLNTNQLGVHTGQIRIPSNDPNTPNFTFDVEATIVEPTQPPQGDFEADLHRLGNHHVEIEVRFVTVAESQFEEIGLEFDFDLKAGPDGEGNFQSIGFTESQIDNTTSRLIPDVDEYINIGGVFTDPQFQVVMRALRQTKGSDLITAPSVVTLAGQREPIEIIREFIYPTEFEPPEIPQEFGIGPFDNSIQHKEVQWLVNGVLAHTAVSDPFIGEGLVFPAGQTSTLQAVSLDIYGVQRSGNTLTINQQPAASAISGQKWHDRNGNGLQDVDEPGLNGWTIEVVDQTGHVVATTTTQNIDVNDDGQIDPQLEAGRYTVDVAPGLWMVREVPRDGWRQTSPAVDALAEAAFRLDRDFDLQATISDFEDWGGRNEKWFYGLKNRQWLFVIPEGTVFEWDGSSKDSLTGREVGQLDATFHENIVRIHDAKIPGAIQVDVVAGQQSGDVNFGNTALGSIEGRKWNDLNADGKRDTNEPWLNGWTITLEDDGGNVVGTTTTADRDIDSDGQIDPETESGWYVFEQLGSGSFVVGEEERADWTQTVPDRQIAQAAFDLDQALNFRATRNDFRNWGGLDERWFFGDDGWYFIIPTGDVFKWDDSPRTALTGTHVSSLSTEYWQNLERLYEAVVPGRFTVSVNRDRVGGINLGSVRN